MAIQSAVQDNNQNFSMLGASGTSGTAEARRAIIDDDGKLLVNASVSAGNTNPGTASNSTANYFAVRLTDGTTYYNASGGAGGGTVIEVDHGSIAVTSLPNIPGGTIGMLSAGTLTSVGTVSGVGVVTDLTSGSVRITVGTITVMPNTPGGTLGLITRVGNVGTLELGTVTVTNPTGTTVQFNNGTVNLLAAGTITKLEGGTLNLVTTVTNLSNGTIQSSGTTTGVGVVTSVTGLASGTVNNVGTVVGIGVVTSLGSATNVGQVHNAGTIQNILAGTMTVNNASGTNAVNIQDGGNSITVDASELTAIQTAVQIMDDWDNGASDGASVSGDVAHDSADAGEPVKIGGKALDLGATPTAVTANDRVNAAFLRNGVQLVLGGDPNVISKNLNVTDADGAQTDVALVTVSAGTVIVVTKISVMLDAATTATGGVACRIGFGTANTPAADSAGIILAHPGIAPGSGVIEGNGAGIIGIGASNEDLRVTCEDPTGGNLDIVVTYFTILIG